MSTADPLPAGPPAARTSPDAAAARRPSLAWRAARHLELETRLDPVVDAVRPLVERRLRAWPRAADVLRGRPLGHALHPLMTDLPIGLWTGATVLDLIGPQPASGPAADRLLGLGVLLALPTAASGTADWAGSGRRSRRVGVVHAALNGTALALYGASWLQRRGGHRQAGVALSLVAGAAMAGGGYLGGHLSFRLDAPPQALSGPAPDPDEENH